MNDFDEYDIAGFEVHHNQKVDSPSGTARSLADIVLSRVARKKRLVTDAFDRRPEPDEFHMASLRVGAVPGTHTIVMDSSADSIELYCH